MISCKLAQGVFVGVVTSLGWHRCAVPFLILGVGQINIEAFS